MRRVIVAVLIVLIAAVPVIRSDTCECDARATWPKPDTWRTVEARITEYCPCCNDPEGYQNSTGKRLEEGDIACRWLDIGTKVQIFGRVYTVADTCGTDAIDIFRDTSECHCDFNTWANVKIKEE